jgi:protein involved in temperature-dependent protein secretion
MNGTYLRGDALWFTTEQACCLAQNGGQDNEWFKVCETAAEYLTDGDAEAMSRFREQIAEVKPDPDGDYDLAEYEGKADDMRTSVTRLAHLGLDLTAVPETRAALMKTAELIADFYGAGNVLDAAIGE